MRWYCKQCKLFTFVSINLHLCTNCQNLSNRVTEYSERNHEETVRSFNGTIDWQWLEEDNREN